MVLLGSATLPGTRYGALNQDHVVIDTWDNRLGQPPFYIALVLDGHGMLGEVAAHEAATAILLVLKSSILNSQSLESLTLSQVEELLADAFHAGHDAVIRTYEHPPRTYTYPKKAPEEKRYTLTKCAGNIVYSHPLVGPRLLEFGTTATVVLVQGKTVAVGHVGDSSVVLGREEVASNSYAAEMLTKIHSGSQPEERRRLADFVGKQAMIRAEDGYLSVRTPAGPNGGTFSLAMTRALGHKLMIDYGVIPTPTVSLRRLTSHDVCIIAASDGVWEGLAPEHAVQEVCDALQAGRTADAAAHALCREAIERVEAKEKGSRADNTTAALIVFDFVLPESDGEGDGMDADAHHGAQSLLAPLTAT